MKGKINDDERTEYSDGSFWWEKKQNDTNLEVLQVILLYVWREIVDLKEREKKTKKQQNLNVMQGLHLNMLKINMQIYYI